MPLTQQDIVTQMVAQLRALDPAASAEVGTPERMILEVGADALADSQIDLTVLQGALDLESKYGSNLDSFVSLFGFARQNGAYATGFVEFGRSIPSTIDIVIPAGTRIQADLEDRTVVFATSYSVTLLAGQTSVVAAVQAVIPGADGNVAAGTITLPVGDPIIGITDVTNPLPTAGGQNTEEDNALKVRFKNQIFRNLSGTDDQYLALAASNANITKANVVGPISRYQEYIQVPEVDDSTAYDINGDTVLEGGNGIAGEYTSALSSIPYSKYIYPDVPIFISNGQTGPSAVFYRRDIDYRMNIDGAAKNAGDAYRLHSIGAASDPLSIDEPVPHQPNVTFTNVYDGPEGSVEAIRPNDIVLFEHSYLSTASRNDILRSITNCIDVYIDGNDTTLATTVIPRPTNANLLIDNPTSKFHYENYRRIGEPEHRPLVGNILLPLIYEPVIDLPEAIQVSANGVSFTFQYGVHYWPVEDITILAGSIRARNGIEWNMDLPAQTGSDTLFITDPNITAITIEDYTYDNTVGDLQLSLESNKQTTTDVLAHRARRRYFKLDLTVMYNPGFSIADANATIAANLQDFFASNTFGSTIQLSDLLQIVHSAPHIDNVRWTSDVPGAEDTNRVIETDRFGRPIVNVLVERKRTGSALLSEIQQIIIAGSPTAGNFALRYDTTWTTALPYNATAADISTALTAVGASLTGVTGTGSVADPFVVTFATTGIENLIESTPYPQGISTITSVPLVNGSRNLGGSNFIIDTDFFLKDNELPSLALAVDLETQGVTADTLPGLIVRPRAQNTWNR